jgi:hypothetical protein
MKRAAAVVLALTLWPTAAWTSERFALVIGNNVGAVSHPKLWFAERDAAHFANVLTEVGDFPADHVLLLRGPDASTVRRAFAAIDQRLQAARRGARETLLVVYYSGHASESGLELGSDRLAYDDLKSLLTGSSADVRVALVDACDSGILTQVKGGRASADVDFPLPSASDHVEGVAFIASASPGESAQESAALQGSFFTRHFEAALRGAGDSDGDGQVTLTEAFRYTSSQTVSETAKTRVGAQHPTYAMRMSGQGDIVLADLRHADSMLVLPAAAGSEYIVAGTNGIVAEVPGAASPVKIALTPGSYDIERSSPAGNEETRVTLAPGESLPLPEMSPAAYAPGARKGGQVYELTGGFSIASGTMLHQSVAFGGQVAVSRRLGPIRARLAFDYGQSLVTDAGLNYNLITTGGDVAVLYPFLPEGGFRVDAGIQLGAAWASQFVQGGPTLGALELNGGGLLSLSYPVGAVRIGTDLSAGTQRTVVNDAPAYRFTAGALITVGMGL